MTQTSHTLNSLSPTYCLLCQQQISSFAVDKLNCSAIRDLRKLPQNAEFLCDFLFCYVSDEYMPEGLSEMSRFSKVSSIFGRDAFATMRYVTLLNVSEIRDISNDERKVPFKNDDYLASGTSSFRRACKSIIRDNKI